MLKEPVPRERAWSMNLFSILVLKSVLKSSKDGTLGRGGCRAGCWNVAEGSSGDLSWTEFLMFRFIIGSRLFGRPEAGFYNEVL